MGLDISAWIELFDGEKWNADMFDPQTYKNWDPLFQFMGYQNGDVIHESDSFYIDRNLEFFWAISDGGKRFFEEGTYHEIEGIKPENHGFPLEMNHILKSWVIQVMKHLEISSNNNIKWLLLSDIINAKWDKRYTTDYGWVEKHYVPFFENETQPFPEDFSKDEILVSEKFIAGEHAFVKWVTTYKEAIGVDFYEDLIKRMSEFGEPENARLTFFFYA